MEKSPEELEVEQFIKDRPKDDVSLVNLYVIEQKHSPDSKQGIYAISKPVKAFSEAYRESFLIEKWLNKNNGHFDGDKKLAYAISHCQICADPYAMFTVAEELSNPHNLADTHSRNKTNFYFPAQTIFNAEILEAPEKTMGRVPKRELTNENGKVGSKITVKQDLLSNVISVPDACMSFARRSGKNVEIFYRIKVRYQIRWHFGLLRTKTEWVEGLKSHIFQHEIGHAHGKNIYFKYYG
jgi:hypothetical protein